MQKRGASMKWFIGVLLLLLAALVLESGLLAFATYVLLGLLLLGRLLSRGWSGGIEATRRMKLVGAQDRDDVDDAPPPSAMTLHAEVGDRVNVRVAVRNNGWLLVPWALLEDLVPLTG